MSFVKTTSQRTMTRSPGATSSASQWDSRIFSASVWAIFRTARYYRVVVGEASVSTDALQTALLSDAAGRPIAMSGGIRPVWRGARLRGPGAHRAHRAGRASGNPARARRGAGRRRDRRRRRRLPRAGPVGRAAVEPLRANRRRRCRDRRRVRDVAEIEELRFPVFAAGVVPTPPIREGGGETGISIACGGIAVSPGDLVVATRTAWSWFAGRGRRACHAGS